MTASLPSLLHLLALNPSYLVAALVIVGMALLYLLQLRHHKRVNRFIGEVRTIRDLREELGQIKQILKQADLQYPLHLLEDLQESVVRIEQKLEIPVTVGTPDEAGDEALDILGTVERRLRSRGFKGVHLLADLPDLEQDPNLEFTLPLEAIRDGVSFKGHVIFREGRIVSERLKPAYEAFP